MKPASFPALLCLSIFLLDSCTQKTESPSPVPVTGDVNGAYPAPPVRTFPSSSSTIQGWIDAMDETRIRAHAWDIWESITSATPDSTPVWETWYSGYEIFDDTTTLSERITIRDFEWPSQFDHASVTNITIPHAPNERVTAFNRYSPSLATYIYDEQLYLKSKLTHINDSFNTAGTMPVDRTLSTTADTIDAAAFALKPVFQFISGDSATALPYWAGNSVWTTTNLINPIPATWRQCVIVDPSGNLQPGTTASMSCNGAPAKEWPVVSLDDFYHIRLTQAMADSFSTFAATSGDDVGLNNQGDSTSVVDMVKAGNVALLMAMHVTGKEISNWTWQTFWWSHFPEDPVYGADRPASIAAPWKNYNMNTAYYMVSPPDALSGGEPLVCFNPYLETNLFGTLRGDVGSRDSINWYGVFSNCMSCHRMAAWEVSNYIPNGYVNPADSVLFSGNTKTDFLWSIPVRAR